jgi:hypothetical protein
MQFSYRKKGQAVREDSAKFSRFLDEKARKGEGYLTGKSSNTKTAMKLPLKVLQAAVKFKLKKKK